MSRDVESRFEDILAAIDRCLIYRGRLRDADPDIAAMAYDAILRNLAVIGEAVHAVSAAALAFSPQIPWASIAGLRNIVIHEYFRVDPEIILDIVDNELAPLAQELRARQDL